MENENRELANKRGIDASAVTDELGAEQNYNMIDGVINNEQPQAETFSATHTPEIPLDEAMPDPAISLSERDLYGYKYDGVLPLLKERALELFDTDHCVFKLYPDDTEAMVFERDEITSHDGIFGIEAADWLASKEYADMVTALSSGEASREAELLSGDKNLFGIYQLKGGAETRDYRFESFESLQSRGLGVDRSNYELVYTGELSLRDTLTNLHKIYETFNADRPEDFAGHSLSVSDVVVLQWRGNVTSHYVDNFSFQQLPSFLGSETPRDEQSVKRYPSHEESEQNHNEISAQANSEQKKQHAKSDDSKNLAGDSGNRKAKRAASELRGKPSILAQVEKNKEIIAQNGGTQRNAPNRGNSKEKG
jgi:hypothetical protein